MLNVSHRDFNNLENKLSNSNRVCLSKCMDRMMITCRMIDYFHVSYNITNKVIDNNVKSRLDIFNCIEIYKAESISDI